LATGIYEQWGVTPIINVSGSVTRLGGALMPREVVDAFAQASLECVPLDTLQGAASRYLAEVTGAEAGIVTCGAAAGLMLGTAAILTRWDLGRMEKLPHCDGFPHEFVEYAAAFGVQTAGVLYVYDAKGCPPLPELVRVAHARGLPVLVDAAGELPPRANLRDIIDTGADLVVFSGGKAIQGPQATGLLCGRRELVGAALLQMLDLDDHFELWEPPAHLIDKSRLPGMPRHGIGRPLKVSKEQIIALLTALRLFTSGAYDAELQDKHRLLEDIVTALKGLPVECRLRVLADGQGLPVLELALDERRHGRSALEVCRSLRRGQPSIQMGHGALSEGKLLVNPMHLNTQRTAILIGRLREEFTAQR
jgi:D-glucosaminate-6-phosphate ammonia-lyase